MYNIRFQAESLHSGGVPGVNNLIADRVRLYFNTSQASIYPTAEPTRVPTTEPTPEPTAAPTIEPSVDTLEEFSGSSANTDVVVPSSFMFWSEALCLRRSLLLTCLSCYFGLLLLKLF